MLRLRLTARDRDHGLEADAVAAALAALRDDGIVLLEDAVAPEHVARLRERMLAEVERVRARADAPFNWNRGNLQQSPPRDPDLLFRDVLVNEPAISVTAALLGAGMVDTLYTGNTAMPGATARQPVHVDCGHLWPEAAGIAPPHGVIINLPLVDMDERNGGTELWPGSHRLHHPPSATNEVAPAVVERRRAERPPFQAVAPAGSLLLRDLRLWHAGMPNRTATPRPMLAMLHAAPWWAKETFDLPRGAQAALSHPRLGMHARWVDAPIDHGAIDHAFAYGPAVAG